MGKQRAINGIGSRVRQERIAKKLTQPQLAKLAGMSQKTVSKIELGNQPTTTKIVELARALDLNPTYLKTGRGPKPAGPYPAHAAAMVAAIARLPEEQQRTIRAYLDVQMPGWDDNDGDGPRTDINIPKEGK